MRWQISPFTLLYVAVFITIVAFSMMLPLLPAYAQSFNASTMTIGVLAASFALAQLLFAPFWGTLSDRKGRKKIILFGMLGMSFAFLIFALATQLWMLFVARFVQGFFAAAVMPTARAYVADLTTGNERITIMGRLSAALSMGIILGPAIGGFFAEVSLQLPFYIASFIAMLNFLFVAKFLKESLHEVSQETMSIAKTFIHNLGSLIRGFKSPLYPLFLLSFTWSLALSNIQVSVPLLGAENFDMSSSEIGILFTIFGLTAVIIQFFFLSNIVKPFGQHAAIAIGLLFMGAGFAMMPTMQSMLGLYLSAMFAGMGSAVARPITISLISEETKEPQGVTMGMTNAFESIGRLIGPIFGGILFALHFSLPFVITGTVVAVIVIFVMSGTHFLRRGHQI